MDQTSETEKIYQKQKYNEIIDILLSTGYFRARINTLSEFDKVVGGLCWCITSSGEDVDVDILFQENSTIGQRIALSEAIVKALRKMNCPSPLQPHQIQGGVGGSDYPSIYPVIIWLVKKFSERRVERESMLRSYALSQFSKNYKLPAEIKSTDGVSAGLSKILDRNIANRKYKRRDMKGETEELKVHACLIEYGELLAAKSSNSKLNSKSSSNTDDVSAFRIPLGESTDISFSNLANTNSSDLSMFEKKLMQVAKEAAKEEQIFAEQASSNEAMLLQQMSQIKGEDGTAISGSQIGAIVGLGSNEIGAAAAAYQQQVDDAKKLIEENLASGKLGQAAALKRQEQTLLNQQKELQERFKELKLSYTESNQKLQLLVEENVEAVDYNQQLKAQINKLSELETKSSQQSELTTLKKLILLNESLKSQENAFKQSCKAQIEDYNSRINALDQVEDENSEENQKYNEIEEMHSKVLHSDVCICLSYSGNIMINL